MEYAIFAIALTVALSVGIGLHFVGLGLGLAVMRIHDRTLIGIFKTGCIVVGLNICLILGRGLLIYFDLPSPFYSLISVMAAIGVLAYTVEIIKNRHNTTIGKTFGVLAISFFIGILYVVPLKIYGFEAFRIPSGNMLPTIQVGDHILTAKYQYRLSEPKRGDIAILLFPKDPSKKFIKRIVGLPGEEIEIKNKKVFINGSPINDPWGKKPDRTVGLLEADNLPPTKLPADAYFCLGDNREQGYDSRYFGPVPRANLLGKAMWRYWPPTRISFIK